jgi:hypothetical protein
MTPALILELLEGLLQAAPEILALFNQASSGVAVSQGDVSAIMSKYAIDRAVFAAAIAASEASTKEKT